MRALPGQYKRAQTLEYKNLKRVLGLPASLTSEAWHVFALGSRGSLTAVELSHHDDPETLHVIAMLIPSLLHPLIRDDSCMIHRCQG